MARHIRNFLPGYSAGQSTADWCEHIVFGHLCEPQSHYEVQYGNKCGRFCYPSTDAGRDYTIPRCNDGHKDQGFQTIEVYSGGGWGGGGCCCTQAASTGGPGLWWKECRTIQKNTYCYVIGHSGCCRTDIHGCMGCWSLIRDGNNNHHQICAQGGYCGQSMCFSNYCCVDYTFVSGLGCHSNVLGYDTTANQGYGNSGANFHTVYTRSCVDNIEFSCARCAMGSDAHHGRAPWLQGRKSDFSGGNDVPYGSHCHQRKTMNYRSCYEGELGEHCGAASHCQLRYVTERDTHGMGQRGWTARECHWGCAAWNCSIKQYIGYMGVVGSAGTLPRKQSGQAWINNPMWQEANTCGGWNLTNYFRCAMGSETSCYQNLRSIGHGSGPTAVCGGPCCCGPQPGTGGIVFRYR